MQDNPTTPVPVHTSPTPPSTHVRRPRLRLRLEDLFPPLSPPARRRWLTATVVILAGIGVAGLLLWLRSADPPAGGGNLPTGLPAQTRHDMETAESEDTSSPATENELEATDTADVTDTTEPNEFETNEDTIAEDTTAEDTTVPDEAVGDPRPDTTPTTTTPLPEETSTPADTLPEETTPSIPDGCLGFASVDVSDSDLGMGYIQSNGVSLPSSLPVDSPWSSASPTVLIVNTQPYEGYGGGSPWYDPSEGGLALTESPNDPYGVVALGTELAKSLRSHGLTVIHLRLSITEGESTASIYARTEEAIRYYRRLYPDIGLVVDLRRSAELTPEGDILATRGDCGGNPCAQLRITVNGGRDEEALSYDVAVALAIRKSLWNESPTLSRPLRIKDGAGLVGELSDLRVLTLEVGSAGNTYEEARSAVSHLGDAIAETAQKYS